MSEATHIIDSETSDTRTELVFGGKRYVLIGTAHVSKQSVDEVARVIDELKPGKVCVELDAARYASLNNQDSWKNLDMYKVIKEGKGFLMLANLMLASFQKRLGLDTGVRPGEEMREAIRLCQEKNIPFALCDRDLHITLRRAWGKSGFWGKSKLLATLLGSAFGGENIDPDEIEALKKKSAMQNMMDELAQYLPSVKTVLIDERDRFLAARIFEQEEDLIVAVVGAGHVPGIVRWLNDLHAGSVSADTASIVEVPKPSILGKAIGWLIPIAIVAFIAVGFVSGGFQTGLESLLIWWLLNGGLAAAGTLLALGHPLTIIAAFIGAPIATLNPFIGIGFITALVEVFIRKPRVQDLEGLQADITSLRGFYKNRVTRILMIFVLSSLGGVLGNALALAANAARMAS